MRLDQKIMDSFASRSKAADAIKEGRVSVNGKTITKPGTEVRDDDVVEIASGDDFVSRAGGKMEAAFREYGISVDGECVLDIGASTGGFTQSALRHGARKVYALDVGHLQLDPSLKEDARVVEMEGINAREIRKDWFDEDIDFVMMDVSFIPSRLILEPLMKEIGPEHMVLLVKPQFEVQPRDLNKNGVLRDEKKRQKVLDEMKSWMKQHYETVRIMDSPVVGRSGNREALLYAERKR